MKSIANLKKHQIFLSDTHLKTILKESKIRNKEFSYKENDFFLDYSKTHLDKKAIMLLEKLAEDRKVEEKLKGMFNGDRINRTEDRPVLHFAWRTSEKNDVRTDGRSVMPEILETRNKMKKICEDISSGKKVGATGKRFLDIVHIGIGGSILPVKSLINSLSKYKKAGMGIYFIENLDGKELDEVKTKLQPETTLFVISTKSFRTRETMLNASYIKEWIDDNIETGAYRQHMICATANVKNVHQFGILEENILPYKNWVGGRFSSFSPASITLPLLCGWECYERILQGGEAIDLVAKKTAITDFLPYKMAMISVWYRNFWNTTTEGIFPYSKSLGGIIKLIQMLSYESNGKPTENLGSPFVFGEVGSGCEHSLFQKFLQNPEKTLSTFILVKNAMEKGKEEMQKNTNAHAVGFAEAFAVGRAKTKEMSDAEVCEGNQPSMTLVMDDLSPENIGKLTAIYEYKTIIEAFFWDINPFDGYGVVAGKNIVQNILQNDKSDVSENLIDYLK